MRSFLIVSLILIVALFVSCEAFSPPRHFERNLRSQATFSASAPSATFVIPTLGRVSEPSSSVLYGKKAARAQGNARKNRTERVKKVKDDVIEIEGTVIESLPNAMFRCAIDGAPETGARRIGRQQSRSHWSWRKTQGSARSCHGSSPRS